MRVLFTSVALLGTVLTMPVYAFHCPVDMGKIDAALQAGPNLSAGQLAKVQELRAEGENLHNSGQHGEAVKTLGEAMKILGIK
ncbi:MAG: hypothetical protein ACE5NW_06055 [Acidiferrobacterales bacterium]